METLGEKLPKEIARVHNLVRVCESVPMGRFATVQMRADLVTAQKAISEGDIAEMVRACNALIKWKE